MPLSAFRLSLLVSVCALAACTVGNLHSSSSSGGQLGVASGGNPAGSSPTPTPSTGAGPPITNPRPSACVNISPGTPYAVYTPSPFPIPGLIMNPSGTVRATSDGGSGGGFLVAMATSNAGSTNNGYALMRLVYTGPAGGLSQDAASNVYQKNDANVYLNFRIAAKGGTTVYLADSRNNASETDFVQLSPTNLNNSGGSQQTVSGVLAALVLSPTKDLFALAEPPVEQGPLQFTCNICGWPDLGLVGSGANPMFTDAAALGSTANIYAVGQTVGLGLSVSYFAAQSTTQFPLVPSPGTTYSPGGIAVDANQNAWVPYTVNGPAAPTWSVARFPQPTGSLAPDPTYLPPPALAGTANAIAVQSNGQILVGGFRGGQAALYRFTFSGLGSPTTLKLDQSFGSGGEADLLPGVITSLSVNQDGGILVAGPGGETGGFFTSLVCP